ncbi:hypothetical protein AlacWU_02908 [Aspergillus niger]|uniref:Uncharacterized protein n=2 Tax=Aspergillus niger TaxID=5061 RepID=A2R9E0_ASPNC|nr:hypothetical protein An17g01030 [Aspergillus niger]GJP90009.1 hypothetical protein AlacWU_02908 [Aspergillus niger]CAK48805.1 hypothetical protein An17g01030 [Aspergillus niger]
MNDEEYETTERLFTKQMKQLNLKISQEEDGMVHEQNLIVRFGGEEFTWYTLLTISIVKQPSPISQLPPLYFSLVMTAYLSTPAINIAVTEPYRSDSTNQNPGGWICLSDRVHPETRGPVVTKAGMFAVNALTRGWR